MNTLWTPGGEHEPERPGPGAEQPEAGGEEPSREDMAAAREQLQQARRELAGTPVRDIVANHAIGLWQLGVLHLGLDQEEHGPADLPEAQLAIDAMSALLDGVEDRLGDHVEPLRTALNNLRLAFVRVKQQQEQEHGGSGEPGAGEPASPEDTSEEE